MNESLAIEIHAVRKKFGDRASLDGLSLTVREGEVFGLLGPNGAGKTTTLRTLLGLVRPDAGMVRILGLDPSTDGPGVRRAVGVLLESDGLYDRLTAVENLRLFARIFGLRGAALASRIEEQLRTFELWDRREDTVAGWSRGMRVRLALARSMLHAPRLLLLDEPFAGLDPTAAVVLRGELVTLARRQGTTVLVTSHDLAHVERSCERVAVIVAGRAVAIGAPAELAGRHSTVSVEVLGDGLTEEVLESMRARGVVQSFTLTERGAEVVCAPAVRSRLATELVGSGARVEEIRTVRRSLEDAFLAVVGAAGEGGRD
jgi:ABC-2 type transport system ATP-binding protein